MSQYCSLFASGEGSSAQERSLIEAAHIIVGRDKLISEGRGLRLLPQLLPASRLSQGGEELGASRLIQGVCGGQPGMFSPGVLAANGVSYVSPLVRAEQVVQEDMARNIVSTARAPAFSLVNRLSLHKTRPSNFDLSLLPDSVKGFRIQRD